ncbi:hypothetical protein Tco_1548675 [Tanacetum coccineum]
MADPDAVSMIQTASHLSPDAVWIIQTASLEPGLQSSSIFMPVSYLVCVKRAREFACCVVGTQSMTRVDVGKGRVIVACEVMEGEGEVTTAQRLRLLREDKLDLENTKTAQAQEITSLKLRVKRLEKKGGLRTHKLRRLYKVGIIARVVSSDEASLGKQEDASKQGRKIANIDADAEITLVDETQGTYGDEYMFGVHDLDGDEVVFESKFIDKAGEKRNIVEKSVDVTDAVTIRVSAARITNVELILAQTLAELKSARPKTKRVVIQEPSELTPTISLQLPSQVKGQGSKDKGKAKMIEPEKPLRKKDQIKFDEEEALRLQAKFDEEDRLAKEKASTSREANIAWDDIKNDSAGLSTS